jgi:hypothetical protein
VAPVQVRIQHGPLLHDEDDVEPGLVDAKSTSSVPVSPAADIPPPAQPKSAISTAADLSLLAQLLDRELAAFKRETSIAYHAAFLGGPGRVYDVKATLDWWRVKGRLYPILAVTARRFLCIPAPSERVFTSGFHGSTASCQAGTGARMFSYHDCVQQNPASGVHAETERC